MSEQTFRVVIADNGEMALFAEDGSFLEGEENIKRIMRAMADADIKLPEMGDIEQHRHDPKMAHLHDMTHQ